MIIQCKNCGKEVAAFDRRTRYCQECRKIKRKETQRKYRMTSEKFKTRWRNYMREYKRVATGYYDKYNECKYCGADVEKPKRVCDLCRWGTIKTRVVNGQIRVYKNGERIA